MTNGVPQTFQPPTRPCFTPDITWSLIIHSYSHHCCYQFESVASRSSDVEKLITVITLNWIWSEWNFLESSNKTLITIRCENGKRLICPDLEWLLLSNYNIIRNKYKYFTKTITETWEWGRLQILYRQISIVLRNVLSYFSCYTV